MKYFQKVKFTYRCDTVRYLYFLPGRLFALQDRQYIFSHYLCRCKFHLGRVNIYHHQCSIPCCILHQFIMGHNILLSVTWEIKIAKLVTLCTRKGFYLLLEIINVDILPNWHCELWSLPSWEVVCPSGQEVHISALLTSLYVPMGHRVHFSPSLKYPLRHSICWIRNWMI